MWNNSRMAQDAKAACICFATGMLSVLALNALIRVISSPAQALEQQTVQSPTQSPVPQTTLQEELDSPPRTHADTRARPTSAKYIKFAN
jgi:hypothetical protein